MEGSGAISSYKVIYFQSYHSLRLVTEKGKNCSFGYLLFMLHYALSKCKKIYFLLNRGLYLRVYFAKMNSVKGRESLIYVQFRFFSDNQTYILLDICICTSNDSLIFVKTTFK